MHQCLINTLILFSLSFLACKFGLGIAAKEYSMEAYTCDDWECTKDYLAGIEYANAKFSEVFPVLEKCRNSMNMFKVYELKDRIPDCSETGNWDGKRSDLVLGWDSEGQIHVVRCYHGFMDGSEFTDFYDLNDYEIKIARWMQQPDLWQLSANESALSDLNELLKTEEKWKKEQS